MPESLADRYFTLIDKIVKITLKGQIRSKEQVYQMLTQEIDRGTGEIFERCLSERLSEVQYQVDNGLEPATATRRLRAIKTIEKEWERWQKENRISSAIAGGVAQITTAAPDRRLLILTRVIDPNRQDPLTLDQLQQLAQALQQSGGDPEMQEELQLFANGIDRGIKAWRRLQDNLVSWMYDQSQGSLGFDRTQSGPWALWAKLVKSPLPQQLFGSLALNQSIEEVAAQPTSDISVSWIELAVILQCLQRGLVQFFDQRVYDAKLGAQLSISTFLTFAVIWSRLGNGFNQASMGRLYADSSFQIALQILRSFSGREYFPLYGGIFASFTGEVLKDAIEYLDQPLQRVEGTDGKARILTLLGYSLRARGQYDRAISFHEQALAITQTEGDRPCEIASYNHLSRIYVAQKNYAEAINYSQRALIFSRQAGDRLGEANALSNLGYSQVLQGQQLERMEPEIYETAISYLEQGLELSKRLQDRQSQSLCLSSLGIAKIILAQFAAAIPYLEESLKAAQFSGDLYLQGLSFAYLAEAYYNLKDENQAIYAGCLGMYLLEQIGATEWRQPAGLVTVLQGKICVETFQVQLSQHRRKIIAVIGVDGYDYIPELLEYYQSDL